MGGGVGLYIHTIWDNLVPSPVALGFEATMIQHLSSTSYSSLCDTYTARWLSNRPIYRSSVRRRFNSSQRSNFCRGYSN